MGRAPLRHQGPALEFLSAVSGIMQWLCRSLAIEPPAYTCQESPGWPTDQSMVAEAPQRGRFQPKPGPDNSDCVKISPTAAVIRAEDLAVWTRSRFPSEIRSRAKPARWITVHTEQVFCTLIGLIKQARTAFSTEEHIA